MILLCGYGGDGRRVNEEAVKEQIVKICKGKTVAIIVNAKPKNAIETDIEVGKFLTQNNIENELFDLDTKNSTWQNFDVLYLGGGSPLRLMDSIRKNGYLNFDWKSKDIIGQSAGAMILFSKFCDSIEVENRELTIEDFDIYEGLGLINSEKLFTPHYNSLSGVYGKLYLEKLKQEKLDTIKLNDKEYLIFWLFENTET